MDTQRVYYNVFIDEVKHYAYISSDEKNIYI